MRTAGALHRRRRGAVLTAHGAWQLAHTKPLSAHIQYVVDPELVESLKGMKRPNTDPHYIRSLIITQLKNLRKKYNKMRLLYSGGTDSHTILKLCIDNDIHIDETITHMVSYIRTPKLNIEYLNGIKFAKSHCPQSIGTVTIIQPQIEDLNFYFKNDWFCRPCCNRTI